MSTPITLVNAAADTFQVWLTRTNLVINAVSTVVMTVNSSANGDITTGNGYVNGVFAAFTIATPTLRGGNVQTTAFLNIVSNVTISSPSILTVGNSSVNATMNSTVLSIGSINVSTFTATSGSFPGGTTMGNSSIVPITNTVIVNTASVVDFFALTTRSAEYLLTVKDNNVNAYQISRLLVIQDGGNVQITEYAILTTNGSVGVFAATINSTAVALTFDPVSSNNATIKGTRNSVIL